MSANSGERACTAAARAAAVQARLRTRTPVAPPCLSGVESSRTTLLIFLVRPPHFHHHTDADLVTATDLKLVALGPLRITHYALPRRFLAETLMLSRLDSTPACPYNFTS